MGMYMQLRAYPNTHMQWKGTALHAAADCGHEDVIELLLQAKADTDLLNEVCTHYYLYNYHEYYNHFLSIL